MIRRTFGAWGIVGAAIALGAVLSTATGLAQARQGGAAPPAQPNMDNVQINALHVQGNIWMLTGGGFNSAISVGDDGILVVDTMLAPLGDKLLAKIKEIGGNKPIRTIINTHAHADHVGGNVTISNASESIVAGNFAGQAGGPQGADLVARERLEPDSRHAAAARFGGVADRHVLQRREGHLLQR